MSEINSEFNRGTNFNAYRGTDYYTSAGGPFVFPASPISFNNFYSTQVNSPFVVSIAGIPNLVGTAQYPTFGEVQISFNTNGTYTTNANVSTPPNPSGNWVTPTSSGIGSDYWIRFTQTASSGTPGLLSTNIPYNWTSMGSILTVGYVMPTQFNASRQGSRTWTVQIATDSAGVNIVATKTGWVWSAATTLI
jgi:hypothetical protein